MKLSAIFLFGIISLIITVSNWDAQASSASRVDETQASTKVSEETKTRIAQLQSKMETLSREQMIELAKLLSASAQHQEAIRVLSMVTAKNQKDFEAKTLIGSEQARLGKDKDAKATLSEVIKENKAFLPAYQALVEIYKRQKNKYELRVIYQDLVEALGPKPEYLSMLCELTSQEGMFDVSEDYCKKALEKDPSNPRNPVFMANIQRDRGDLDVALATLKKATQKFQSSEFVWQSLGAHYDQQKNYQESYAAYKKGRALSPKSMDSILGFAKSAVELRKYDEGLQAYKTACDLDRVAITSLRRAGLVIRQHKAKEYTTKFDSLIETCGLQGRGAGSK